MHKLSAEVVERLTSVYLQISILVPSIANLVIVLERNVESSKHLLVQGIRVLVILFTSIARVKVLVSIASSLLKEVSHIRSHYKELRLILLKFVDH
jgi:hypothetical protein